MQVWHAVVLGIVEGLTEYLPISSTGHLILASSLLHLHGEAVKTFEIVIQAGAVAAVLGLYRGHIASMFRGLLGQDPAGQRLAVNLLVSFLPAAVAGLLLHDIIKTQLFGIWPVMFALAAGGAAMILFDWWQEAKGVKRRVGLEGMAVQDAFLIGLAQVLSLWPGTSRAMVTLMAGMALGLSSTTAAEYSFLLALPTLGAATLFDMVKGGEGLFWAVGPHAVVAGFLVSFVVAVLAVQGFLRYLTQHGLAPFGWYRVGLALAVFWAATH